MQAVIVEDEVRNADVLKKLLEDYCPGIKCMATAPTVKSAVEEIKRVKPGLVFLDVELPDGSGFDVLNSFPDNSFRVIFVTAYEHYALKALKTGAMDYLLKPIDIDDLTAAVNKAQLNNVYNNTLKSKPIPNENQNNNILSKKIALPTTDGLIFIEQMDIVLCEAEGNYTSFLLKQHNKVLVSKPLSYFEEVLNAEQFCRTHQSYIINLAYVKSYVKGRGGYLIMNDGTKVEVSVRMKNNLLDRFIR